MRIKIFPFRIALSSSFFPVLAMASCAEFISDVNVPLTLSLSVDASTNLVEDGEPVTPTSQFRRRRSGRRTNRSKKVVPLILI